MPLAPHLYRRGATYWWRRILPDLGRTGEKNHRREIRLSLRTNMPGLARQRARRLSVVSDAVLGFLSDAMLGGTIDTHSLRLLVGDILALEVDRAEVARSLGGPRGPAEQAARARAEADAAEALRAALAANRLDVVRDVLNRAIASGLPLPAADTVEHAFVARQVMRSLVQAHHANARCEVADYPPEDGATLLVPPAWAMRSNAAPAPVRCVVLPGEAPASVAPVSTDVAPSPPAETAAASVATTAAPPQAAAPREPATAPETTSPESPAGDAPRAPATPVGLEAPSAAGTVPPDPVSPARAPEPAVGTPHDTVPLRTGAPAAPMPNAELLDLPVTAAVERWIDVLQGRSALAALNRNLGLTADDTCEETGSTPGKVCKEEERDLCNAGRLFAGLLGDKRIRDITRADARTFKHALGKVPALHGRGPYRGLSPADAIRKATEIQRHQLEAVRTRLARGEIPPENALHEERNARVPRLAKKTINKHLDCLGRLFKWLRYDADLPVDGALLRRLRYGKEDLGRDASEERDAWTDRELRTLFATPNWTGCAGPNHRHRPGERILKDDKYWVPQLEAMMGLRLGEASQTLTSDVLAIQLEIADLKRWGIDVTDPASPWPRLRAAAAAHPVAGTDPTTEITVWCLQVTPGHGKRIKNASSKRLVPLHPQLLELGFLDYVARQRAAGIIDLFPGLHQRHNDRHGGKLGEWFIRYLRFVGMHQAGRANHSMRHSFDTHLINRDVPDVRVSELLGHSRPGQTTGRYYKGAALPRLVQAIASIDYGLHVAVVDGRLELVKPAAP